MINPDYPNECGVVVEKLVIHELITLVEELDNKELRKKFLRLLCAMYESDVPEIVLVYPPVRGKQ